MPQARSKGGDAKKSADKSAEMLKDMFMDQPLDLSYDILCDSSTYLVLIHFIFILYFCLT